MMTLYCHKLSPRKQNRGDAAQTLMASLFVHAFKRGRWLSTTEAVGYQPCTEGVDLGKLGWHFVRGNRSHQCRSLQR